MRRFAALPPVLPAFLVVLSLSSLGRGAPGDRIAVILSQELGPVDVAYDEGLGLLWATSFQESNLRPYSTELAVAATAPIDLPFRNPLVSWITGVTYNCEADTFFVAETFNNEIHEVRKDGSQTGRSFEVPLPEGQEDPIHPWGLAFDSSGHDGEGSVYVALGTTPPQVYELTLEGELLRSFPPREQLDVRFGENGGVRINDVDLIREDGNLVGFYVSVSLRGNNYQILRLDADGNLTDKWLPLDEAANSCDGILRRPFRHPDTGEEVDAFICVQSMGSRFVVLEAGELIYHKLFDFTCAESDRSVTLTWKGFPTYDSIEILDGGEVLATLPGDARRWESALGDDGVYALSVRARLGDVETQVGSCSVVLGPGQVVEAVTIPAESPRDLASNGELHIVSDAAERRLLLFGADFLPAGMVPISESFAAEEDQITAVAFGDEPSTAFVYNLTRHQVGKIHFSGDLLFAFDARLPNIELDPLEEERFGYVQNMIFDPLAAGGSIWVLEEARDFLYELSLNGLVQEAIPHPYLALDPLPEEAGPSVLSAGLSWRAEGNPREIYLLGRALRNHGEPTLFRFDLDAKRVVPGSAIPTHQMGSIVAVQHVLKAGKPRLIVLVRSLETRLLEVLAEPYVVAAPSFFTCRQKSLADDVELTFTTGGSYDQVEVFRDGEKIGALAGGEQGAVLSYTDPAVEPGIHVYAVRGKKGEGVSVFTRSSLRVGVGAILARQLSYPVRQPRSLAVDPVDGTFYVADASTQNERSVFHFDTSFDYLEAHEISRQSPWQVMAITSSLHPTGESLLHLILSEGDSGNNFLLVTQTTGGDLVSEVEIFPPALEGFRVKPFGLTWDPSSNTLYYFERHANTIVHLGMAGDTLRSFPSPVPLPNIFVVSEGLTTFRPSGSTQPAALFATAVSSPADDRVNRVVDFDVNGRLKGHEIPLPGGSFRGMAFVGNELVVLKTTTPGEFIRLKAFSEEPGLAELFIRGDANDDLAVNLSDAIYLVAHLFQAGPPSVCEDSADANDDGKMNLSDAIYSIDYLFRSGLEPPPPFRERGSDPTGDPLSCR